MRAVAPDPADGARALANTGPVPAAFGESNTLGHQDLHDFGATSTAHLVAYLRIAGAVTVTVARLTTGLPGCGFDRAELSSAG
jgi:hypothetical protein